MQALTVHTCCYNQHSSLPVYLMEHKYFCIAQDTLGPVELVGWLKKCNKGGCLSILWKRNTQKLFYLKKNLWWTWCRERIMLHWVRMKSCSVVCHFDWKRNITQKSEISVWYFGVTNDQGKLDLAILWLVRLDQIRFAEIILSRNSLHIPKWNFFLNWFFFFNHARGVGGWRGWH